MNVTHDLVKELTAPAKGYAISYDGTDPDSIRGFGVRITAAGVKSFVLNYRLDGSEFRHTIGQFPTWTVKAAREEAKRLRKLIDQGTNPVEQKRERREAATVNELADRYIAEYLPRKAVSSQIGNKAQLVNDILPAIGRLKVAAVTLSDMERLHSTITNRAPIRANRVLATASKMFSLAIRWGMRTDNPCRGIERNAENQRRRYLSPAEIASLSEKLAEYPSQTTADVIRFCLLTGCRSGEAMTARWEQFDLGTGTWNKATSETKQRRFHSVPLSAPARMLLSELRAKADAEAVYVFPGRKPGEHLKQIRTCWEAVRPAPDVRVHDLRHSFASIAASGGASLPIIGALLGHTQARTTQRYAHLFDDPLRQVADRVGATVTQSSGQIVDMRKGGAA